MKKTLLKIILYYAPIPIWFPIVLICQNIFGLNFRDPKTIIIFTGAALAISMLYWDFIDSFIYNAVLKENRELRKKIDESL